MACIKREQYQYYALVLMLCFIILSILTVKASSGEALYLAGCGWGLLIYVILRVMPAVRVPGRRWLRSTVLCYAASGAVCYLAICFVTGAFLKKLATSPYDGSVLGIFNNLVYILPALIATELVRAYTLGAVWRCCNRRTVMVVLITAALFLADLNYGRIVEIKDFQTGFIYAAQNIAPQLTQNILLSVLVLYGGAPAGIVYMGTVQLFQRLFPFLPSLPWIAQSAIGICFPVIYALIVYERCKVESGEMSVRRNEGTAGFTIVLLASVAFCWFCVGVFPVYPSVVLTGSMEPLIDPGDVVLIKKILKEQDISHLSKGDIINFKRDGITITHRIIDVYHDEAGNLSFETKGDNNDCADVQLVLPNDINGTIRKVIPKVGLPVLVMKSSEEVPEGVVDDQQ